MHQDCQCPMSSHLNIKSTVDLYLWNPNILLIISKGLAQFPFRKEAIGINAVDFSQGNTNIGHLMFLLSFYTPSSYSLNINSWSMIRGYLRKRFYSILMVTPLVGFHPLVLNQTSVSILSSLCPHLPEFCSIDHMNNYF